MQLTLDHSIPPEGHPMRAMLIDMMAILESQDPDTSNEKAAEAWAAIRAWEAIQRAIAAGVMIETAPGEYETIST